MLSIVGESGSGKSLLFNVITELLRDVLLHLKER
ncbi:ATP-binding cassette domain-containing protein [Gilliamella apicola]|uniref:ATP-binding cassette domain-containing protein n=1 Tax=Gilliamella apicola TaxID=1196095 RepID=A0A556RP80_9GAMM|nr:ATP-binding cassette domain-containing protein [Gilliamella apicola]